MDTAFLFVKLFKVKKKGGTMNISTSWEGGGWMCVMPGSDPRTSEMLLTKSS
jgi:hypothetical protein